MVHTLVMLRQISPVIGLAMDTNRYGRITAWALDLGADEHNPLAAVVPRFVAAGAYSPSRNT